jgi:pilus assembly protein Flp/PilA
MSDSDYTKVLAMPATLRNLFRHRKGATAIEYGLIAALISVGCISAFQAFGNGLMNMWGTVSNEVGSNS